MLNGYSISAISIPIMALAYGWPLVLVAQVMDRTGEGLHTSGLGALIADSSDIAHTGRFFRLHKSMDRWQGSIPIFNAPYIVHATPGK
ncbi:MAG: hypothetical protein KAR85_00075 [Methanosarcinales archaeon]|nr:hypothetical protein [Methanosarcinales archaeon]